MPKALDRLPEPAEVKPLKVIGVGASRTGTIGLFQSLRLLGYTPFHITELLPNGITEMAALQEAMIASETDKPWTREQFNKLFGKYDCLVECPCYFGGAGLQTFVSDPDIKFIYSKRSPASFSKSIQGTLGTYFAKLEEFPLNIAQWVDPFVRELYSMFGCMVRRWSHGLHPRQPGFGKVLEMSYIEYEKEVLSIIPPERLLILDLDKGFGFEEICSFLDVPVPDEPYPRSNTLAEFHVAAQMVLAPALKKTKLVLSSGVVGVASVGLGLLYYGKFFQNVRR